jgi:tetratricopeptide (TPR) repeat protein
VDEGIGWLQQSLQRDPRNAQAHYLMAMALGAKSLFRECLEHYQMAMSLDSTVDVSVDLHGMLGLGYEREGQYSLALTEYEKALQLARIARRNDTISNLVQKIDGLRQLIQPR